MANLCAREWEHDISSPVVKAWIMFFMPLDGRQPGWLNPNKWLKLNSTKLLITSSELTSVWVEVIVTKLVLNAQPFTEIQSNICVDGIY